MDKPNMNVVIFDDDQQPSRQEEIRRYTSTNRSGKPSSANGHSSQKGLKKNVQNSTDKISVLSKQMSQLQSKIKSLQRQGQRLKYQMEKKGNNPNMTSIGANNNKTTKQIQQILMIVQKKIQVIIQQSKKLLNKMTQTVQRKLSSIKSQSQQKNNTIQQTNKVSNNNGSTQQSDERLKNRLNQIQIITKQKLQQYEQFYKNQFEKLIKQAKRKQQSMMKRLSEMELKFANKINTFQTKQKQYVDWIHHLEAKLKERKSKKMITITQQKPQVSPIGIKNSGTPVQNVSQLQNQQYVNINHQNNLSSANFQTSRANMSISDQNNSKVVRKHKIFGNSVEGTNKSVSPLQKNQQKQSPTKDSLLPQKGLQNIYNQPSSVSSFYQQPSINNNGNLNFYSELKRSQIQKVYQQPRQQQETQYKFADLNQFSQQYNESEQDDFFAPIQHQEMNDNYDRVLANIPLDSRGGTYYRQTVVSSHNYGYDNYHHQLESNNQHGNINNNNVGEKVFSPFDLN